MTASNAHPAAPLGLGLDVGGTRARWALADAQGQLVAEGAVGGFSGLQLGSADGRETIQARLGELAAACAPHLASGATLGAVCAGVTGFDGDAAPRLAALAGAELDVSPARVVLYNDIELACRATFKPGEGYLVYAGTGSVAAFIDERGQLQRAGGRGGLLDDGGGGYWIATQALRLVWRTEDEDPGAWQRSPMARALFERIGGPDWARTREFVYNGQRGDIGELALAVAQVADHDPLALALLQAAGEELARLARALAGRHGVRTVALSGRVFELHGAIEQSMRAALPGVPVRPRAPLAVHVQAARLAAMLDG
jgi:glucosamine kinase